MSNTVSPALDFPALRVQALIQALRADPDLPGEVLKGAARDAAQSELLELSGAVTLDADRSRQALWTLLIHGDPDHPIYPDVCERLWAGARREPAGEFGARLRLCAALALNAPQGGEVRKLALLALQGLSIDLRGFDDVDRGPRLAQLMHREMLDLHQRSGVELAARNRDVSRHMGLLLLVLEHAERPERRAVLRNRARGPEAGAAVAECVEAACWALVDRLLARSPRLACEALIELIAFFPEADQSPYGRDFPTERIRYLCEMAQAKLQVLLGDWVQREAWACGTLVLRLIHDSRGGRSPRRQIGAVLDRVFPLLARQDPGLAKWTIRAGERSLYRTRVGAVWPDGRTKAQYLQA